jgi:DNA-binding PadR family transcriptional regulator
LVRQGLLSASWGISENNRKAKFYELTALGRKQFEKETEDWNRIAGVMATVLAARVEEA